MSKVFQYFQLARYPDTVSLHLTKSECTPPIRELEVTSLGKTPGCARTGRSHGRSDRRVRRPPLCALCIWLLAERSELLP